MTSTRVNIFLWSLLLLLLTNHPTFSTAACTLGKNGISARCHNLEDIAYLDTYQLKSLKVLTVGRHLSATIFSNLTSLRHLDLSNGKLKKVERGSFKQLRSLRTLDLSNNHLTHLVSATFQGLRHIQSLNLSENALEHIPQDALTLKSLKQLDLTNNNLHCDCKTLKSRDVLLKRGVDINAGHPICGGPHNLKGRPFVEPDAEAVCLFDEHDLDEGMQMDQPATEIHESSGAGSGDGFDEIQPEDIPEDENEETEVTTVVSSTSESIVALTPDTTSTEDEIFFSEETDKSPTSVTKPIEMTTESVKKLPSIPLTEDKIEGSGDDEAEDAWNNEGSGLEGSGTGIVPPITWEGIEHEEPEESTVNHDSITTTTTTESAGIIDTIYGLFWGPTAAPNESSTKDLNLEEEEFIPATPETPKESSTEAPVIVVVKPTDVEQTPVGKSHDLDDAKSGKVQAEVPTGTSEIVNASEAKESQKGMGSYVVLAVLLGVLTALIGLAAYKGDFCKGRRKRNERTNLPDLENGTELKDLRKSLLDQTTQPKIATNGKPETVPLMVTTTPSDTKIDEEPTAKYVGTVNEATPDPVKPPRKSFSPTEVDGRKNGTNGISTVTPDPVDVIVNGRTNRDSLSSIGESPSSGSARHSNSRLSSGIPASPITQRVTITLQENPDSVPKTPLLITRTKAGANLVNTP